MTRIGAIRIKAEESEQLAKTVLLDLEGNGFEIVRKQAAMSQPEALASGANAT